jgi:signal transduction histidine kinase
MNFPRPVFLLLCFYTLMFHSWAQAPWKTFAETPPTTNLDSLTKWLDVNPKPTPERLKNLIKAERTYFFLYPEKMGKHLPELERLSKRFNHKAGQTAYHYLTGRMLLRDDRQASAMKEFQEAYKGFERLKDTSGTVHTLAGLVTANYEIDGVKIGDHAVAFSQLTEAERLVKLSSNLHDYFVVVLARCLHIRGDSVPDFKALTIAASAALKIAKSKKDYEYAGLQLHTQVGIGHLHMKQYAMAYRVFQELIEKLRPDQYAWRVQAMYNLSMAALMQGHYKERLEICVAARNLYNKLPQPRLQTLHGLYWSLGEEYNRLKDTRKAKMYADSMLTTHEQIKVLQQKEELINLQIKYRLLEQEKQVIQLQLRQVTSDSQLRLILTTSGLLAIAALISFLLVLRMSRLNTQLKSLTAAREHFLGMVAHDLRRPLSAFHGMAETVSYYLKEGNFSAIEKLSHSIDQSGAQTQQLLDNVVTWTLSQRQELPYYPVVFPLREQVHRTVEIYQAIYAAKQPTFEVLIPEAEEIYMDANAFDLIVRNIIDNALKAAEYPVHISISAHRDAPQHITVSFEDNAGGMSPQQILTIQRIFDQPKHAQIGENGIGMGIVMIGRFVKRNRGRIVINGTLGHGTQYTLTLPMYP